MKKIIVLAALVILVASPLTFAGKIYKWTDSNGNVHYGAQPPSQNAKQMKVPSAPSSSASAAKPSSQTDATNKLLDSFAKDRKDKNEASSKTANEQKVSKENCSRARKRIASLNQGGRRYEMTEEGERSYLDQVEIQKRLKKAQEMSSKWCK